MARAEFPMRWYRVTLLVIAVFAVCPIVPTVLASVLTLFTGCELHEGFTNPCVIGGTDWGDTLYVMGSAFWFLVVTVPMSFALFVLCMIVLGIHQASWRGGKDSP
jgi:hypothetical protein